MSYAYVLVQQFWADYVTVTYPRLLRRVWEPGIVLCVVTRATFVPRLYMVLISG